MRIVIIGGGIMGLVAAWACRRRGHTVELFEAGPLPNPAATSHDRLRVLAPVLPVPGSGRVFLPLGAVAAWCRLAAELAPFNQGPPLLTATGTLLLCRQAEGWTDTVLAPLRQAGREGETLAPDHLRRRFPVLAPDCFCKGVLFQPDPAALAAATTAAPPTAGGEAGMSASSPAVAAYAAGSLLAMEAILEALVQGLSQSGAVLHAHTPVQHIDPETLAIRVAEQPGWRVDADALLLTAGVASPTLLEGEAATAGLKPSWQGLSLSLEPPLERALAWARMPIVIDADSAAGLVLAPPTAGAGLLAADHRLAAPILPQHPDMLARRAALEAAGIATALPTTPPEPSHGTAPETEPGSQEYADHDRGALPLGSDGAPGVPDPALDAPPTLDAPLPPMSSFGSPGPGASRQGMIASPEQAWALFDLTRAGLADPGRYQKGEARCLTDGGAPLTARRLDQAGRCRLLFGGAGCGLSLAALAAERVVSMLDGSLAPDASAIPLTDAED